jgi:peptidoglycan/LPS O-acetylase OafA/YrhL
MYGFAQVYDPGPATGLMVQAWTLDVEVAFYLVLPVAAAALAWALRGRLGPRGRLWTVLALLAVVFGGSLVLRSLGSDADQYERVLPTMIFAFVPGIALAALELLGRERRGPAWLHAGRRGPALAVALLPAALGLAVLFAATGAAALAALATGALVAAPLVLQWTRGRCWHVLDNRVMDWLGVRSYSIYLVHFAIGVELVPLARHAGSAWAAFALTLALCAPLSVTAAALVYRFVERPFLGLRMRWKREGGTVPVRSTA